MNFLRISLSGFKQLLEFVYCGSTLCRNLFIFFFDENNNF